MGRGSASGELAGFLRERLDDVSVLMRVRDGSEFVREKEEGRGEEFE